MANGPMREGTTVGEIKTSMNSVNAGKKGGGSIKTYGAKEGAPSSKGGADIKGPGNKNSYQGGA
jgi:hypothetical protein